MLLNIIKELETLTNSVVKIGAEIEFYLNAPLTIKEIKTKLQCENVEKEDGQNQFEARIGPLLNIHEATKALIKLQKTLKEDSYFNVLPKPYKDQPSNGTHIHINLIDKLTKKNLYQKQGDQGDKDPEIFLYSIGGLLTTIEKNIRYFAPSKNSYLRYTPSMHTPTKICWGINNRTAAIRIPHSSPEARRIEHRVPSSDCLMEQTIYAILEGVLYGIKNQILPDEKVYGNAFLPEYNYKAIPRYKSNI